MTHDHKMLFSNPPSVMAITTAAMMSAALKLRRSTKILLLLLSIFMVLLSSLSRPLDKINDLNWLNSDATYHALLTMTCYDETPASEHLFLPTVSLGHKNDKNTSWGETVPDEKGNFYYTSFASLGFAAPYAFCTFFRLPIEISSLIAFNAVIEIACLYFLGLIIIQLFGEKHKYELIITGLITYSFMPEVLHGMGLVYWHQSLLQLIIIIQLYSFIKIDCSSIYKTTFFLACLLGPLIEWSAYIGNLGYIIYYLYKVVKLRTIDTAQTRAALKRMLFIASLSAIALAIFVIHYFLRLDISTFLNVSKSRFNARSGFLTISDKHLSLILPLVTFGCLFLLFAIRRYKKSTFIRSTISHIFSRYILRKHNIIPIILLCAVAPPIFFLYADQGAWVLEKISSWVFSFAGVGCLLLSLIIMAYDSRNGEIRAMIRNSSLAKNRHILFVSLFICMENIILLQHASSYTYDRMKWAIPLSLMVCDMISIIKKSKKLKSYIYFSKISLILYVFLNVAIYHSGHYFWDAPYKTKNMAIAKNIRNKYSGNLEDVLLGIDVPVRGYINLLFHKGIIERTDKDSLIKEANKRGVRYAAYIQREDISTPWNMYAIQCIYLIDTTNHSEQLISE